MFSLKPSDLVVVRHAPAETGGRLCGRRDVPAILDQTEALDRLAVSLAPALHVACSPALRCRQTAERLFPDALQKIDDRLWEQDFGAHDGLSAAELPNLGPMSRGELADYRPPGGESFADMVHRTTPALRALASMACAGGPVVVVAHAGTARALLGVALDEMSVGLGFEIAPLSVTCFRCFDGGFAVAHVNLLV